MPSRPAAAPSGPATLDHAQQYTACMQLAKTRPREAYASANAWFDRGGAHAAQHCAAIALFGLGDYVEAANRLERLAREQPGAQAALRAELYGQAGQAWLLAGSPEKALAAQGAGLALSADSVELLIDRAIAAAGIGRLPAALSDLDTAIALAPGREDALTLRATVLRLSGQPERAAADVDAAIAANRNYAEAYLERGLQRKAGGQAALAREDFIKVLRLVASSSELAVQARAQLERSDVRPR